MDDGTMARGLFCNLGYVRSIPGILKIIELVCDFLALILGAAPPTYDGFSGNKGFFIFVTVIALVITLAIFIIDIINVPAVCLTNQWPVIEIGWCLFIALFYFIGSIVIAVVGKYNGAYAAAAFFGFIAMFTYIGDAFYRFRARRNQMSSRAQQYAASMPPDTRPQPTY